MGWEAPGVPPHFGGFLLSTLPPTNMTKQKCLEKKQMHLQVMRDRIEKGPQGGKARNKGETERLSVGHTRESNRDVQHSKRSKTLQGNRQEAEEGQGAANRALRRENEEPMWQSRDHLGRVRLTKGSGDHEHTRRTASRFHEPTEREEVACNEVKVGLEAVTGQVRDEAACA